MSSLMTKETLRKESDEDYEDFLERIDWAIEVMEDFGDGEFDEIDTLLTTFKLDREPGIGKIQSFRGTQTKMATGII